MRYAWLRDMNDSNSMGKKDTLADLEINFISGNGQLVESYYLPSTSNGTNRLIGQPGDYVWGTSVKYSENEFPGQGGKDLRRKKDKVARKRVDGPQKQHARRAGLTTYTALKP